MRDWIVGLIGAAVITAAAFLISAWPAHAQDTVPAAATVDGAGSAAVTPATPIVRIDFTVGVDHGGCSGVYVGHGLILTAGHCLYEVGQATSAYPTYIIRPDTGVSISAEVAVAFNTDAGPFGDLMLLKMTNNGSYPMDWKPVTWDCHYKAKVGDKITAQGFPVVSAEPFADATSPDNPVFAQGYVNGKPKFISDSGSKVWGTPVIPVTIPVAPGFSGGGAFDEDGDVIGLVVGQSSKQPAYSYIQPLDTICPFLPV